MPFVEGRVAVAVGSLLFGLNLRHRSAPQRSLRAQIHLADLAPSAIKPTRSRRISWSAAILMFDPRNGRGVPKPAPSRLGGARPVHDQPLLRATQCLGHHSAAIIAKPLCRPKVARTPFEENPILRGTFMAVQGIQVLACFDPQWPDLKAAVACFEMEAGRNWRYGHPAHNASGWNLLSRK